MFSRADLPNLTWKMAHGPRFYARGGITGQWLVMLRLSLRYARAASSVDYDYDYDYEDDGDDMAAFAGRATCQLHASYMPATCQLHGSYMAATWGLHAGM